MTKTPEHSPLSALSDQALEIGARLRSRPSQKLIDSAFHSELNQQIPLFDALSRVDLAHTLVLAETDIIPRIAARDLLSSLRHLRLWPENFQPEASQGDLYTNREVWLTNQTAAGYWLGAGRARREALTSAYIITLREQTLRLTQTLIGYGKILIKQAEVYRTSLMPDYTYLQIAQPTSFGHYLLSFAYPVLRDLERLHGLYTRLNLCPAGCGSSNGSRLPQPRERLCLLLGFDGLIDHTRDAMWQADLQIEIAAVVTALLINLDRLAEDLQIFTTAEFDLLQLDDRHARASKIMPQKKNPFALTHIRSLANSMIGTLTASAALGRTPTGQPDNRLHLYGALPKAIDDCNAAVTLMSEVIELTRFNNKQARFKLEQSFTQATDLAEVLVLTCQLSFREAHKLVGFLVHRHLKQGNFNKLTSQEINQCAQKLLGQTITLNDADLAEALNIDHALDSHQQTGTSATVSMEQMLLQCRHSLAEAESWRHRADDRLHLAEQHLQDNIDSFLAADSSW